jgi:hypothetical protein
MLISKLFAKNVIEQIIFLYSGTQGKNQEGRPFPFHFSISSSNSNTRKGSQVPGSTFKVGDKDSMDDPKTCRSRLSSLK